MTHSIETYMSGQGYRFRVRAGNGEIVASSEEYSTAGNAQRGARGLVAGLSALSSTVRFDDSGALHVAQHPEGQVVEVHHYDVEKHAESFNEGFEAAMALQVMSDEELAENTPAQDWFHAQIRSAKYVAWDEGHHAGVLNATGERDEPLHDNTYGPEREADIIADAEKEATDPPAPGQCPAICSPEQAKRGFVEGSRCAAPYSHSTYRNIVGHLFEKAGS